MVSVANLDLEFIQQYINKYSLFPKIKKSETQGL